MSAVRKQNNIEDSNIYVIYDPYFLLHSLWSHKVHQSMKIDIFFLLKNLLKIEAKDVRNNMVTIEKMKQ